jgi:hypothetical protein
MEVKLFIYQDATIYNQVGLTADNTLISSDSTLITADQTFQSNYNIERIAIPIDLFDDEEIKLTSSIQNINDISKIFTDYTQSFTIPASKKNNETFRHWYENEIDNGFNQLIRYDGFIEIDNEIFRVGKWQLESASVKQNKIENYKITFYGVLTSLNDKFKEDKLKDILELNDYSFQYTGANVQDKITTTSDSDVLFPLISSDRIWQYSSGGGGGGGSNNINSSGGRINHTELFPALKIARIFDAIASKYNVNFSGNFLTQSRFTKAYLFLKNKETFLNYGRKKILQFNSIVNNNPFVGVGIDNVEMYPVTIPQGFQTQQTSISLTLSASCNWQVSVLLGDSQLFNLSNIGQIINFVLPQNVGVYRIFLSCSAPVTYTGSLVSTFTEVDFETGATTQFTTTANVIGATADSFLDLTALMPDIKVSDFFSGILKMFNLTAFSFDESNYTLEQLENWYYQGFIKDFSQYTITDLDFQRIKPYKKVNFNYEKSESILNKRFSDTNQREFGDLSYPFNNDGTDYNIKLPFENILFNKFTDTNLQVAYAVKSDFSKYVPKPIILYQYENTSCNFFFNNGSTTNVITNYNVIGQDVKYQNEDNTLNFGLEISSYLLEPVYNTLFQNYYFDYLKNLYNLKSRMVKVSLRLPYSELINLRLNDRIVIRDKRYIINTFTTNLKTFEVEMELIQDFRSINFNNSNFQLLDNVGKVFRINTTSREPLEWEILDNPIGQIISVTSGEDYVEIEMRGNFTGVMQTTSVRSNNNDIILITQNV